MADPRKTFGDLLRATRIAKGYSLRKFAAQIKVSPTYLSQIEQGKVERPPTAERVQTMAQALGQNPDEWVSLAGRIPKDVSDLLRSEPSELPALLRATRGMTAEQLRKLREQIEKENRPKG